MGIGKSASTLRWNISIIYLVKNKIQSERAVKRCDLTFLNFTSENRRILKMRKWERERESETNFQIEN